MEKFSAITPEQNREMASWIRKILAGEASFLQRLIPDDWARFIVFVQNNGIAPILYHAIQKFSQPGLAEHMLHQLRNIYLENAHRNIFIYHEMERVLRAFHEADISVIVLKGGCLAKTVYGNIALRSMGDVDLLVKKDDIGKVAQVLSALGYSAGYDCQVENEATEHLHLPPMKGPNKLSIEVHWTIFDLTFFDARDEKEIVEIWERAQPLTIGDAPCLMMSPEDLLLHLCIHISCQHLFDMRLRGFLDLRKVVEYYGSTIDWNVMQQRASRWRVDRAVRLTIFLAERWLGLELPDQVKQSWRLQRPDPEIMIWIERKMFDELSFSMGAKLPEFIADKSILKKIGVLFRQFFPPRVILARLYAIDPGGGKIYFFYPVRWLSLCRRFGPAVWKSWKGDATILTPLQNENSLRHWLAHV